jgi:hypothetical protein
MFKFPGLNTGLAKTLTLNALPETMTCKIEITLYTLSSGKQIGSNFVASFNNLATVEDMSIDVSNARWLITKGEYYYLTIQTLTLDNDGAYCNMKLLCGQDNTIPPVYGIVTQQGPCVSPWTTLLNADGGYIHMKIEGQRLLTTTFAVSNSIATGTATATATATGTASPSATPTIFVTYDSGYTRFSPTVSPLTTRSIISSYSSPVNTSYVTSNIQKSVDPDFGGSITGVVLGFVVGFILGDILLFPIFQSLKLI